jgi:hypothetical protein
MPAEWEPARVAQFVVAFGVLVHVCWVRPWNARRALRTAVRVVEADVHADVTEGYLSGRSAGYVDLRSRIAGLRKRPSRAVHLLDEAWGRRGAPPPGRPSFTVRDCPDEDRPRLAAYLAALDDAVRDYVSTAHPIAWWQLRTGRPVRRLLPARITHPQTATAAPVAPARAVPATPAVPEQRPAGRSRPTVPVRNRATPRVPAVPPAPAAPAQAAPAAPAAPAVPAPPAVPAAAAQAAQAAPPAEIRLPDPSPVDVTRSGEDVGQVVAWPRVDQAAEPDPWGAPQDVVASSRSWATGK